MADVIKPLPGPNDYISPYNDINYSIGPKVLYGNPDIFQVILNDPQQDSDDEWGMTEEIALRMISDELINLHSSVFGYSSIVGLTGQMTSLLALFTGWNATYTNPSAVTLAIGNTALSSGSLVLGTGTSFASNLLSMNGVFSIAFDPTTSVAGSTLLQTSANGSSVSAEMIPSSSSPSFTITVTNAANTSGVYQFTDDSFSLSDISFSASSGTFGSLSGGVMTGISLSVANLIQGANLTLTGTTASPVTTATITLPSTYTSVQSNYITAITNSTSTDTSDVLNIYSNNIQFYIKAAGITGYQNNKVLYYTTSGSPAVATAVNDCNVAVNGTLYLGTGPDSGGYGVISFLQSPNTSTLAVNNDGSRTRWTITGSTLFDFGGDLDTPSTVFGVRILANDQVNNVAGLLFSGKAVSTNILMDIVTGGISYSAGSLYGLVINPLGGSPASLSINSPSNGSSQFLIVDSQSNPQNYILLDNVKGISTGQNSIKFKTYSFSSVSWPGTSTAFLVDLPLENTSTVSTTYGVNVSVITSGNAIYSPGNNAYSVNYFYNSAHSDMALTFSIPATGPLSGPDTVIIRVVIFYSSTTI